MRRGLMGIWAILVLALAGCPAPGGQPTDGGEDDGGVVDGGGDDGGSTDGGSTDGGTGLLPFEGADVAGRYATLGLTIGDMSEGDWVGWDRGRLDVNARGGATLFDTVDSDGYHETELPLTRVSLAPSGVLRRSDSLEFFGAVAPGGAYATTVGPEVGSGGLTLTVLTRLGAGLELADAAGTWQLHGLAGGSGPTGGYAFHGTHTIDAGGLVATERVFPAGGGESVASAISMGEDGRVIWNLSGSTAYRLSADGRLLAGTYTDANAWHHLLELAVRPGTGHVALELEGDWTFVALATGGIGVNAMGHGALRLDDAGHLQVIYQAWTPMGPRLTGGELTVTDAGEVTSAAMPSLVGHVSADGRTLLATYGEGDTPGALLVAHRRPLPPTVIHGDATAAASAVLGPAGGTLTAEGADGTRYTLSLPPGALAQDTPVTLTPAASVEGRLPVGTPLGLAELGPEGLELAELGMLTLEPSSGRVPDTVLGFSHHGRGADDYDLPPALVGPGVVGVAVLHFSGTGAVGGSAAEQDDPDAAYELQIKRLIISAIMGDVDVLGEDFRTALNGVFQAWFTLSILPRVGSAQAFDELEKAVSAVFRLFGDAQLFGVEKNLCEYFPKFTADVIALTNSAGARILQAVDDECRARSNACIKRDLIYQAVMWKDRTQWLNRTSCLTVNVPDLTGFCAGRIESQAYALRISPAESGVFVDGKRQLEVKTINGLGQGLEAPEVAWTLEGGTASVGLSDTGLATGVSEGLSIVHAASVPMPCLEAQATVHVNPNLIDPWDAKTVSREVRTGSAACEALPETTRILVEMPSGTAPEHPSAVKISWKGQGADSKVREDMSGAVLGRLVDVRGEGSWPEQAGTDKVQRVCHLKLDADRTEMNGTCTFDWEGTYIPGVGYTGCHGTDTLRIARFVP